MSTLDRGRGDATRALPRAILGHVGISNISLLHGAFPQVLAILALVSLGVVISRPGRTWWLRRILPIAAGAVVAIALLNQVLDLEGRFGEPIPFDFVVWVAMPVAAIGIAVVGWRGDHRWRQVLSIAAVPLTMLYAANLINQYYGYEPTLGALFNSDVDHQVPADQLGLATVDGSPSADGSASDATVSPVLVGTSGKGTPSSGDTTGGPGTTDGSGTSGAGSTSATGTSGPPPTVGIPKVSHQPGHGAVARIDIPGTISGFHGRTAWVWVPPAFFATPRPHLPVVVMMAGVPGQPDNMIRAASADRTADAYAAAHGGVAPILVLPDPNGSFTGDTECVDGPRGKAETYLTQDVPNFVTQAFSSATGPSHWAMAGYSEGGTCAMVVTMRNPNVYGTFVDISGDPFPNVGLKGDIRAAAVAGLYHGDDSQFDAHDPTKLATRPEVKKVAGWFETGTNDRSARTVAVQIDAVLRANGIESHLAETSGGHDFPMATKAVADSFAWLAGRVGA